PDDAAVLDADVRLDDARPVDDQRVRDDDVERVRVVASRALPLRVAEDLSAAELALIAVARVIALDLDEQIGVAEANAIAGRGPEHVGIVAPVDRAHCTSLTVLASPGSKRTAVPAGMSS